MIIKQIRVKKELEDGTVEDVVGDELKEFRSNFITLTNKPTDFAIILPEDVKRYILEAVETEINDSERILRHSGGYDN
jgi:hypothetical protein